MKWNLTTNEFDVQIILIWISIPSHKAKESIDWYAQV